MKSHSPFTYSSHRIIGALSLVTAASFLGFLSAQMPFLSLSIVFGSILGVILLFLVVFIWKKPVVVFTMLMALFPFQSLGMRVLRVELGLSDTMALAISMWKELILLMLIIRLVLRTTKQTRFRVKSVDLLLASYTAFVFVYVFVANSLIAGLYGFRGTVEPFAFYFIARRLSIRSKRLAKIINCLLIVAVLVSVFGFVQAYVLGYSFLLKYAIDPITNRLANSNFAYMGGQFIIRASSTFSSPNQFGMYIAILILVGFGILSEHSVTGLKVTSVALVLIVGLLTTFSRSSWLAFGTGFLLMFGLRRKIKKQIVVVVFVLALLALPVVMRLNIFERVAETVSLADPSAAGRLPSIMSGIEFVQQNPLGVGLGTSGPRSVRFDKVLDQHAENFYVLMAMEIGVAGLLLYLVLIGMTVLQLYWTYRRVREPLHRGVILGTLLALVGSSTGVVFIPSLQAIEVASLLWFFIGISVSAKSVQTLGS